MSEEDIFCEAIQYNNASERETFLAQSCGTDKDLLLRIQKLIQLHDSAHGFLESPAIHHLAMEDEEPIRNGVIGPYRIIKRIGAGGMGVVFLAEQIAPLRRQVALKLMRTNFGSREMLLRFEAEKETLSRMEHPNIAKVLDAGILSVLTEGDSERSEGEQRDQAGRPYFAMEFVDGLQLMDYCRQFKLSVRQRLEVLLAVCRGVQHAHQKGIVHRDLKPANIIVATIDEKPSPKIIDFGIAKGVERTISTLSQITLEGQLIGTPEYMSPEQLGDRDQDSDTRSDVYSLGIVLYELITETTPFRPKSKCAGELLETLRRVRDMDGKPASVAWRELHRDSPHRHLPFRVEMDWIIRKAIDKQPEKRYQTVAELANDIERYLEDSPILAKPKSRLESLSRFIRKSPGLAGLSASVIVLATTLLFGSILVAIRLENARVSLSRELAIRVSAESAASRSLFESLLNQADGMLNSGMLGQQYQSLGTLAEARNLLPRLDVQDDDLIRLRNRVIASLLRPDFRRVQRLPLSLNDGYAPIDHAKQRFVEVRQNEIRLCSVINGEVICSAPVRPHASILQMSDSGDVVLGCCNNADCFLWYPNDARRHEVIQLPIHSTAILLTNDGKEILWTENDQEVRIAKCDLPLESRAIVKITNPSGVEVSPDRRSLATFSPDETTIRITDITTGEMEYELPCPGSVWNCAWSRDGKLMAVEGSDYRVYLFDLGSQKLISVLDAHQNALTNMRFVEDTHWLVTSSWDRSIRVWDASTGRQILWGEGDVRWMSYDGVRMSIFVDEQMELVEFVAPKEIRKMTPNFSGSLQPRQDGWMYSVSIHPSGEWIAACGRFGVYLWDTRIGHEAAALPTGNAFDVRFSQDGTHLLAMTSAGLLQWPVQRKKENGEVVWGIDVPKVVQSDIRTQEWHLDFAAKTNAVAYVNAFQEPCVLIDEGLEPIKLKQHLGARYLSLSPDGSLLASGSFGGQDVRVYDLKNGGIVYRYPSEDAANPVFSPDGNSLKISRRGFLRTFSTKSWKQVRETKIDSPLTLPALVFSQDGESFWISMGNSRRLSLNATQDDRSLLQIESGNASMITDLDYRDDKGLLAIARMDNSIEIVDLKLISEKVRNLGFEFPETALPLPRIPDADQERSWGLEQPPGTGRILIQISAPANDATFYLRLADATTEIP